jgi:hypothetical protein
LVTASLASHARSLYTCALLLEISMAAPFQPKSPVLDTLCSAGPLDRNRGAEPDRTLIRARPGYVMLCN